MEIEKITCQGLNSLGGCHRRKREFLDLSPREAISQGMTWENSLRTGSVVTWYAGCRPGCDGWAGCRGGCNE